MTADPSFRPEEILRVLHQYEVRYVLIGGLAASLRGSVAATYDVDITPEVTEENLTRLSDALRALNSRIRVDGVPEGLAFSHNANSLIGMSMLNLTTDHGSLDIVFHPPGVTDYGQWNEHAADAIVLEIPIRVAAIDDLIRSKEAANREKDHLSLPQLRALRDRQRP